ncbi:MAG: ParB N-terminal domain-containing protein [Oscillospiraceae bacterium]|nr:ParB N-terminal domain-containing protein [Oscillospiraceae bacterium]
MPIDLEKLMKLSTGPAEPETPAVQEQKIIQVPIDELVDFPPEKHRFRPATGQRLKDLEDSIRINGILNALLIRILPDGTKQILTGHNRRTAARNIGYKSINCIIKDAPTDDEALLIVIHDNLHNRDLLPSERGWAYRDSIEIRNRQGKRTDLTFSQNEKKLDTYKELANESGHSKAKVHRYIRLTWLIDPLLELVDQGKIALSTGEQLSYLSKRSQQIVYDFCYASDPGHPLKESHAKALREVESDPDRIVDEDLLEELTAKKQSVRLRTVKLEMSKLRDYFPVGTPEEVVKQTIQTALAIYFEKKEDD